MNWQVYEISPIDLNWEFLPSVESVAKSLAAVHAEAAVRHGVVCFPTLSFEDFLERWKSAQDAASAAGWAGDHHQTPRVLWFPVDDAFSPGFAIKQNSNGITYIISPVALPHLVEKVY